VVLQPLSCGCCSVIAGQDWIVIHHGVLVVRGSGCLQSLLALDPMTAGLQAVSCAVCWQEVCVVCAAFGWDGGRSGSSMLLG